MLSGGYEDLGTQIDDILGDGECDEELLAEIVDHAIRANCARASGDSNETIAEALYSMGMR